MNQKRGPHTFWGPLIHAALQPKHPRILPMPAAAAAPPPGAAAPPTDSAAAAGPAAGAGRLLGRAGLLLQWAAARRRRSAGACSAPWPKCRSPANAVVGRAGDISMAGMLPALNTRPATPGSTQVRRTLIARHPPCCLGCQSDVFPHRQIGVLAQGSQGAPRGGKRLHLVGHNLSSSSIGKAPCLTHGQPAA